MIQIESLRANGLNTDTSPEALDNGGNRMVVNPLIHALNARYFNGEDGKFNVIQNPSGNTEVEGLNLPAGVNVCIGSYEDKQNNRLVFFNFNENDDHGIYSYSAETSTFTTHILNPILNFYDDRRYLITNVSVLENLLFWSDGINPQRQINLSRDYTGISDERHINFAKPYYQSNPYVLRRTDLDKKTNFEKSSWQFRVRFILKDNEKTLLSPYSTLISARTSVADGNYNYAGTQVKLHNYAEVSITVPLDYELAISSIQFIYIKNNDGVHHIFKEVKKDDGEYEFTVECYGDEVTEIITDEELIDATLIPNTSTALTVFKDRVFLNNSSYNLETTEASTTVTAVAGYTANPTVTADSPIKFNVGGCRYSYGLVYHDGQGRNGGVVSPYTLDIPLFKSASYSDYRNSNGELPSTTVSVDGVAPEWAHSCSIVMTENLSYQEYMHAIGYVMFYDSDFIEGQDLIAGQINDGDKIFNMLADENDTYEEIYIKVPNNLPLFVDGSYKVRICEGVIYDRTNKSYLGIHDIIKYDGDKIVIKNPLYHPTLGLNRGWVAGANREILVEIFKPKEVPESLYYEAGTTVPVTSGASFGFSQEIEGDAHYVDFEDDVNNWSGDESRSYKYKAKAEFTYNPSFSDNTYATEFNSNIKNLRNISKILSPTSVVINKLIEYDITTVEQIDDPKEKGKNFFDKVADQVRDNPLDLLRPHDKYAAGFKKTPKLDVTTTVSEVKNVTTFDYNKKSWNRGRAFIVIPNNIELSDNNLISYGRKFIQGSNFNDLSVIDLTARYALATERSPLVKFQPVGEVLLAIHERNISSLYIEKNIQYDTNGEGEIVNTGKVIGADNELTGNVGAYHAESIAEINGMAFGFDIYTGVVWRYTKAGLFPISNYGMTKYFKNKSEQYLPTKATTKIIGTIDPFNNEYILSFPDETIAFDYKEEKWVTKYSYIPEYGGSLNTNLFTFNDGKLYQHNLGDYNTFYGTQYNRELSWAVNPKPTKSKTWDAVQLNASSIDLTNGGANEVFEFSNREGQLTNIEAQDFELLEGVYYGYILKDTNTPNFTGDSALLEGDDMRSKVLTVKHTDYSNDVGDVNTINILFTNSEYSQ
jgi:hypothetical protein